MLNVRIWRELNFAQDLDRFGYWFRPEFAEVDLLLHRHNFKLCSTYISIYFVIWRAVDAFEIPTVAFLDQHAECLKVFRINRALNLRFLKIKSIWTKRLGRVIYLNVLVPNPSLFIT